MSDFIRRHLQTSPVGLTDLPDDLQSDILLRMPLHHHRLRQASQVCPPWRSIVRAQHNGIPPLVGVFHSNCFRCNQRFTLTGDDRSATSIFQCQEPWRILHCRHGRVLFLAAEAGVMLVVWDPMTGSIHRIPMPPNLMVRDYDKLNGAVVCTARDDANGHHGDCRSSPFRLVLLTEGEPGVALVSIYSVIQKWSQIIAYEGLPMWADVCAQPCVVIGNTVYQPLLGSHTLSFDLQDRSFTVISHPPLETKWMDVLIMKLDGTKLGLLVADNAAFSLHFWEHKDASDWVLRRTVMLSTLQPISSSGAPPPGTSSSMRSIKLLGACEYGNVIFLGIGTDTFEFYLDSMQMKKLLFGHAVPMGTLSPYESFYAPR